MGFNIILDANAAESAQESGIVSILIVLAVIVFLLVARAVSRRRSANTVDNADAPVAVAAPVVETTPKYAPGSCGEVATFSVPDRTAAMVMAVTADQLNVPLNEIRFISIKEVK